MAEEIFVTGPNNEEKSCSKIVFGNITMGSGALLFESAADGIVAFAGGGQGSATLLTNEVNRVVTVATAGDSVKLPAAAPGLTVYIINHGANSCQVYGSGTDTINDVAAATGVSQMVNSEVIFTCSIAGKWYSSGLGTGYSQSYPTQSFANNLTATGSTQGTGLALTAVINRVTTVAASTGVVLPVSAGGMSITVANAGANSLSVYPATGDAINALSANTAFAVASGKTCTFFAANAGTWHTVLSA